MSDKKNPRDYGYGDDPKVVGVPIAGEKPLGQWCPNCRCASVFAIEVEVANPSPLLRRPTEPHKVIGRYVGCPACPWASPMVTMVQILEPF
jgi:hypothetical protein